MRTIVLPGTAALAAALFLAATLAAAATGKPPTARTESGVVSGVAADGVVSWRGVPSAAPPLGDLRCVREERRRQRRGRGGAPNPAQAARQRARPRAEPDDHGPAARHVRGADGRRAGRRGRGRDGVPRRPAGQGRVPDRGEQPRVRVHGAAGPCGVDGMLARFGAEKDKVLAAYDPEGTGNKGEVEVGLISDGAMVEPARLMARLATAAGQPTYEYRFSYVASSIRRNTPGAPRGFGAAPAVAGPARPLTAFLPRGRRSPPVRASSARWPVLGRGPRKARAPVAMRQRRRPRS